jgi:hypothetical protein
MPVLSPSVSAQRSPTARDCDCQLFHGSFPDFAGNGFITILYRAPAAGCFYDVPWFNGEE